MVGAPLLVRYALPAAAVLAGATLIVLATVGERENTSLAAFHAAGPMLHIDPAEITEVRVAKPGREWRFERAGGGWRAAGATQPLTPRQAGRIEAGLKLLHNSAPEREFTPEESSRPADFGLASPALRVTALGNGKSFMVEFGSPNPLGLARYTRVGGSAHALLLPSFVADTWFQALEAP